MYDTPSGLPGATPTQHIKIFNTNGSESGEFEIDTSRRSNLQTYQILARAITVTIDRVYIGFDRWHFHSPDGIARSQWANANVLWAYTLEGERVEDDDIDLPNWRGARDAYGIIGLDWDSTNDQLWVLVNQKEDASGANFESGVSTLKFATVGLGSVLNSFWSAIPAQTMMSGDTLDLNVFTTNTTNIQFGEDYNPVPWITLNAGIITIATSGVPQGATNVRIPLLAIGRNDPAFTNLNLTCLLYTSPSPRD